MSSVLSANIQFISSQLHYIIPYWPFVYCVLQTIPFKQNKDHSSVSILQKYHLSLHKTLKWMSVNL